MYNYINGLTPSIVRHIKSLVIWDKYGTTYEVLNMTLTECYWTWQFLSFCRSPKWVQWIPLYVADSYVVERLASSGNKCYGSEVRLGCVLGEWILTVRWYYLLWIIEFTKSTTELCKPLTNRQFVTSQQPKIAGYRCVNVRASKMLIF